MVEVTAVKVAVRVRPSLLMAERVPPVTVTSPLSNELPGSSRNTKDMVAVWFTSRKSLSLVMMRGVARVYALKGEAKETLENQA